MEAEEVEEPLLTRRRLVGEEGKEVVATPMILAILAITCMRTGGVMASA
jgi:hypothetical protein